MKDHLSNAELAKEWRQVPLSEIVDFRRGLTYKKSDEVEESPNAVLRANNVDRATGELDLTEIRYINPRISVPASKKVVADSLLICTASGSKSHLGKVAYIGDELDFAFGGFMGLMLPCEKVLAKYLFYFMRSDAYWGFIDALSSGVNINNLKFKELGKLTVPLPPLEEQKRIVAVLDQAFAALDRARAYAEANLADAGELFDSWLNAAFELGAEHWPTKTLPDISENLDRLRVPITKKDRKAGDVPYYGASGVVDHVAEHIFDEDLLLVSEDGANLLARTYPIAFSISGKSWVNNHAHVLRFGDSDTQEFVRLYLNSISIEPWVSGMAQPKLNQKALAKIPIPYPAESDRKRIVAEAESIWTASEAAQANYRAQIADIADLRQSLLQNAFSGQLT